LFLNNPVFFSQYLAPEVLKKQPYDKTVDWWCLGAVLYEMMYGLPPFYSRDTAEMYDNILYKPLRLRTNVSASARSILEGVSLLFFFLLLPCFLLWMLNKDLASLFYTLIVVDVCLFVCLMVF
jgi:serine/threonine protein kinase